MPIVAADLKYHNALNRPEDDTSLGGGARDLDVRPNFTQLAVNDGLEVLSDNAADTTQNVTANGRDAAGARLADTKLLIGLTIVSFVGTWERVLFISMDADAVGIVTVQRTASGPVVYAIPIAERGASATFIESASEVAAATRYDKVFWLNDHASLTLNSAAVELTADPAARIRQGIAVTKDDTATIANRKTAPGGITFVDDSVSQSVPGNTLEAAAAIGLWIEQALLASDPPIKDTFTTELSGTSV